MSRFVRRLQQTSKAFSSMPIGDIPGWTQVYTQDFTAPAALGQIGTVYGSLVRGYDGVTDTSGHGTYSPDLVLSAYDSMLDYYMHTEGGKPRVAAPIPMGYSGQTYGRYSVRFRSDVLTGYKMAFLLWPSSDSWAEGEIDWPEGELGQTVAPHSALVGSYNSTANTMSFDPSTMPSPTTTSDWHIATIEWMPGIVKFYWDGGFLAQTSTPSGVPTTNMRWTLQAETSTEGAAPASNVAGHLQVDWIVAYAYNNALSLMSYAKTETLVDTFSSQDTTKWSTYGNLVAVTAGEARLQATTAYPVLRSYSQYDLTSSAVYARLVMPSSSDSSIQSRFTVYVDNHNYIEFLCENGHLTLRECVSNTNDDTYVSTYSATTHAWLRLRMSGTTVYWETSPDGTTWTIQRSKTTTLSLTATVVQFGAGNWNNVSNPGYLAVQSVNTLA